jgi:hypothetical protein
MWHSHCSNTTPSSPWQPRYYFNDTTVMGTQANLPRVMDLINIIKY